MKKFFVSAGLVALGAASIQSAIADDSAGPKYWSVGATLRGFYDDNYNISGNQKGSFGVELVPTVSLHVPLQQTDMGIRYTYGLYYYQDRQDIGVNPFDQTHQVDLWLDHAFNERWHGKFNDTFASGQEPELLSPNPTTAVATPYRVNGDNISNHGSLSLDTDWTRLFSTTLAYENSYYNYDDSGAYISSGVLVSNGGTGGASLAGILDRDEQDISLDAKWHLKPETTVFVGYQFAWADFLANEPITAPLSLPSGRIFTYHSGDRDYYTHYMYVGLEQDFTPNLTGVIRAGGSYTDAYADPVDSSSTWAPYVDLSVSYTYLPGSYVQLGFTHDISSTDQVAPDSAGQITQYSEASVVYLDVNHRITSKLMATVIGRIQYSTYQGGADNSAGTTDYGLGVNLSYQINNHFSMDAGYNYDNVQSDIIGYGYTRNRVYLGLTATY